MGVSRVGDDVSLSRTFKRLFRRDAETYTRDARTPRSKQVVVQGFFHLPESGATMLGETVKGAQFSESAELFFGKGKPPPKIVQRSEAPFLPLPDQLFRMLLAQSVYHA